MVAEATRSRLTRSKLLREPPWRPSPLSRVRFSQENQPRKNPSARLGFLRGDLSLEILAPIFKEFQRWRTVLQQEFQIYLIRKNRF
jgi:hypothetical protein